MGSVERFEIIRSIGEGGQGQTYLAFDHLTGEQVALKRLALRLVDNWKAMELFEREGDVLEHLTHPQIPTFVDTYVDETEDGPRFYLAQEYVDGRSLQSHIDDGERWGHEQTVYFLRSILGVLDYLGALRPPIVHRDIKPANIIQRSDGSWALVDFGAVQAIVPAEAGGSTVVGTTGYVPPEQVMGRAEPRSDLYALAATVVHLMTGEHPGDLSAGGLRIDFRELVDAPPELVDYLETMLAPCPEDRFESATAALDALDRLSDETSDLVRPDDDALETLPAPRQPASEQLVRQVTRLGLSAETEDGQICVSVWSPIIPLAYDFSREGPMMGAAWFAMGASAFLLTGGWIASGLGLALFAFMLVFGLAGRVSKLRLGGSQMWLSKGASLFERLGERIDYDAIDDFVVRDRELLILVGVREISVPMGSERDARKFQAVLTAMLTEISTRPRPLAKLTTRADGVS